MTVKYYKIVSCSASLPAGYSEFSCDYHDISEGMTCERDSVRMPLGWKVGALEDRVRAPVIPKVSGDAVIEESWGFDDCPDDERQTECDRRNIASHPVPAMPGRVRLRCASTVAALAASLAVRCPSVCWSLSQA
eukprot:TRINITY_DN16467_c0_g1_i4.p3 TRINITY_DN16467_c0_g1~~TRINITY_DN16467_c0_g1_i4.p3  ORF type:complete len:134 (-),score=9.13 TRINITY_DN16467_c0_g1_i4:243-644(-)